MKKVHKRRKYLKKLLVVKVGKRTEVPSA